MAQIGDRIRMRREELGITQDELARRLGYKSRSSVNKIELGKSDIYQSQIIAFAKALNTTPAYLMGWDEEKTEKARASIDLSKVDPRLLKLLDDVMSMPESQREKFFNMMISSLSILLDQQEPEKK